MTNELSTHGAGKRQLVTSWGERNMNVMRTLPRLLSDTGQKKTPEKKDGRRMSFQRPKGTIEYSVSKKKKNNTSKLRSLCVMSLCVLDASLLLCCCCCCCCFSLYMCVCVVLVVTVAPTSLSNLLAVAVVFMYCEGTVSDHASVAH